MQKPANGDGKLNILVKPKDIKLSDCTHGLVGFAIRALFTALGMILLTVVWVVLAIMNQYH